MHLGQIVLYSFADAETGQAWNNYAASCPAIVVRIWSNSVNLKLIVDGPEDFWRTSISEGPGPGKFQKIPQGWIQDELYSAQASAEVNHEAR